MPEAQMHKVMAAYFEWLQHQEESGYGNLVEVEECECPPFGAEVE